jgi:glutathione S-transferase
LNVVHTDDPNLAELKPSLPFGQLPYLVDGDVKVAQSLAIVRYLARKGGLQGDDDKGFAFSEMLIQEMEDIFTLMAKANYEKDKVRASLLILTLKFVLSFSAIPTSCNL